MMTREEAIRNHRKMWNWLAENPEKSKADYLLEFDPEVLLYNVCYLCDYAKAKAISSFYCWECPLEWPGENCCINTSLLDMNGLFIQWGSAKTDKDYTLAAEIARQIAELPEKEVEE